MKILIPKQPRADKFHHTNDSFRSLLSCWKENGWIDLEETDSPYVWINKVGDILLYDRPLSNTEWLLPFTTYRIALFGNQIPQPCYLNCSNWIFWARHPKTVEEFSKKKVPWEDRNTKTIFIGNIENDVQQKYSSSEWKDEVEFFSLTTGKNYIYTQEEYLEKIQQSRFGLCLRGYGPKCHREMEYMALGVVPIITDNVCLSYFNELEENVHYIRVEKPSDINPKISKIGKTLWTFMSESCRDYYLKYCSIEGSFNTTLHIVSTIENRMKSKLQMQMKTERLHSICSFATGKVWKDLEIFLHAYLETHGNLPFYIMLDDEIEEKIKPFESKFTIIKKNCLNNYSGKNRKEMEKEGIFKNLMRIKMDLMEWVLENEPNTLYTDADIVLLYRMDSYIDFSKDIGLSPHKIHPDNAKKFGYYNAGFLFVQNKSFPDWWRHQTENSYFDDQGCLDNVPMEYSFFEFHDSCNFGWWRMFESCEDYKKIQSHFSIQNNRIMYKSCPLTSIHTHFHLEEPNLIIFMFNSFMCSLFEKVNTCQFYQSTLKLKNRFIMIQQYYNDNNDNRQKELDFCLECNLDSLFIKKLILWNEADTVVPDQFKNNQKVEIVENKNWINFKDVIEFTNMHYPNDIILLANLDIFLEFNFTFSDVLKCMKEYPNIIFCNSRIEVNNNRGLFLNESMNKIGYGNCQDAWIFKGDIPSQNCDIPLGYLGSENAFAYQCKENNLIPINLGMYLPLLHFDNCRGKTMENQKQFHKDKIFQTKDSFMVPTMKFLLQENFDISKRKIYHDKCIEYNKKVKIIN